MGENHPEQIIFSKLKKIVVNGILPNYFKQKMHILNLQQLTLPKLKEKSSVANAFLHPQRANKSFKICLRASHGLDFSMLKCLISFFLTSK